jgi:hypothetical protein
MARLSEYVISDSDADLSDTSQATEDDATKEKGNFINHFFVSSDPISKRLLSIYYKKNRTGIKINSEKS